MLMAGKFKNDPRLQMFSQMMSGKNYDQQKETLLNYAQSKGYDRSMIENLINSSQR